MKISSKMERCGLSPMRKFNPYAQKTKERGIKMDSLGVQSHQCYEVATRHHKPVIVMEPVKGGTLAKVPEKLEQMFKSREPEMSVPSWAIRFAASLENVMVVLSGMSNMEQLLDNTGYMKDFKPLTEEEQGLMHIAAEIINDNITVPCTGCSYCTVNCPRNIAIPKYFSLYNLDLQEAKEKDWTPQGGYYERLTLERIRTEYNAGRSPGYPSGVWGYPSGYIWYVPDHSVL